MAEMRHSREIEDDEFGVINNQPVAQECLSCGCQLADRDAETERLRNLLNTPLYFEFTEAARREAAHQVERWGTAHDRAKEPQDWYWLLAYLSGKALRSHIDGDQKKALHHTISSAAVLLNWHAAILDADHRMQPGSSDVQRIVEATFGPECAGDATGGQG